MESQYTMNISKNIVDASEELQAIEQYICYIKNLKYHRYCRKCDNTPLLLSGIGEELFYEAKDKFIEILNSCYNKKSNEIIKLCDESKK